MHHLCIRSCLVGIAFVCNFVRYIMLAFLFVCFACLFMFNVYILATIKKAKDTNKAKRDDLILHIYRPQ